MCAAGLGAVVVLIIGIGAWSYQIRISARRATIDFISNTEVHSADWLRMRRALRSAVKEGLKPFLVAPSRVASHGQHSVKSTSDLLHCDFLGASYASATHGPFRKAPDSWDLEMRFQAL